MKRSILLQYIDACELVKETQADIIKLEQGVDVHDKVYGSNPEFPYEPRGFSIHGFTDLSAERRRRMKEERKVLEQRERNARELKTGVEKWLNTQPPRIVRIIRLHYFEGLSWEDTADRMGRGATGDSVRMEIQRFLN